MKKWCTNKQQRIFKSPWLSIRKDEVITASGVHIDDFYVIEYPTWVNVIAITSDGLFVIEQQYRHGLDELFYELCAGKCESHEKPIETARRELLEETGYGGGDWSLFGKYAPNPNSMNNWCYTFLAKGVIKMQEPQQEETEEISVHLMGNDELKKNMRDGKMAEGVMLAPLWQYFYETTK